MQSVMAHQGDQLPVCLFGRSQQFYIILASGIRWYTKVFQIKLFLSLSQLDDDDDDT